jgi:hypothetical protein
MPTPLYIVYEAKKSTTFTTTEIFFNSKGCSLFLEKIFNKVPLNTSKLHRDSIYFKSALRKFLVKNVFYTRDEFLSDN